MKVPIPAAKPFTLDRNAAILMIKWNCVDHQTLCSNGFEGTSTFKKKPLGYTPPWISRSEALINGRLAAAADLKSSSLLWPLFLDIQRKSTNSCLNSSK